MPSLSDIGSGLQQFVVGQEKLTQPNRPAQTNRNWKTFTGTSVIAEIRAPVFWLQFRTG